MGKNIILCADGTGNKGGYTADSNVYKTYKAIDKHHSDKQVLFYDNGVGTHANKFWRALSGGLGFGFKNNVKDLYRFLARNYEDGDSIYLFGFSRGAATIRGFSGFLACSGLVKSTDESGISLSYGALEKRIDAAMRIYEKGNPESDEAVAFSTPSATSHGIIDVHFIGVWDTVSALGFPQRTDPSSLGMRLLNGLLMGMDRLFDFSVFKHRFYNYELSKNVKHAYQALAIDDERTAFWPLVWDETTTEAANVHIEQVWFAGMHSNVGGGYGRSGLASLPLYWMLTRPELNSLIFESGALQTVFDDSHEHGRMYDSRDRWGIFYRYHPRELDVLCDGKLENHIKIHNSVLERMEHRTANYTPGQLPGVFEVVSNTPDSTVILEPEKVKVEGIPDWRDIRKTIKFWVKWRKWLYGIMLETTLAIVGFAVFFWLYPPNQRGGHGLFAHIADILNYVLPDLFSGLIEIAVIQKPYWFIGFLLYGLSHMIFRRFCRNQMAITAALYS